MFPYQPRSDSAFTLYSITPDLPEGVSMDPNTGIISGTPASTNPLTTYTVTASNVFGSVSTSFAFEVKDQSQLTARGISGVFFTTIQSCNIPGLTFFNSNDGKAWLDINKVTYDESYSSSHGGHVLPGLDGRFRDFWSSYYHGYLVIPQDGEYTIRLSVDDGGGVYIDNFENPVASFAQCGDRDVEGTIYLTAGKHSIFVSHFEVNFGSRLHISFKQNVEGSDFVLLSSDNCFLGGKAPSFVHYDAVTGFVNSDIMPVYPTFHSAGFTSITVSPPLPAGLYIDNEGVVRGSTSIPTDAEYTVTISGHFGITQTTLRVRILTSGASGVLAKFHKIQEPNGICEYKEFSDYIIDLRVMRIDNNFYYPDTNGGGVIAPGMSDDMAERTYNTWEGYLYFDEVGVWGLRGQSDDGFRFSIGDEVLFENMRCGGIGDMVYTTFNVPKIGYYPVKVLFFDDIYGDGLIIAWKRPLDYQYSVIPDDHLFYVPEAPLTYTSRYYNVFVGAPAIPNYPVVSNVQLVGSYTVSPALPEGLSLDPVTGAITGTVNEAFSFRTYTISNGAYSTEISIVSNALSPISNLRYDRNPDPLPAVYEATVGTFFEFRPLYDGRVDTWSCTPEPPRGLYIESHSGWFKGTPEEISLQPVTYTLSGCNQAGCSSAQVTVKVGGCDENHFYYTKLVSGDAKIVILEGENVLDEKEGGSGVYRHCFGATSNLVHKVECRSSAGCSYAFYRDDLVYIFNDAITTAGSSENPSIKEVPFTLEYSTPSVSLESTSVSFYRLAHINPIKISITGTYKEITITPALPSTATLNKDLSQIEGYFPYYGTFTYTIQATNSVGASNIASLTVNVISCGPNKNLIRVVRQAAGWAYQESFTITQNGVELLSCPSSGDNALFYFGICVDYGTFELNLYDHNNEGNPDGWAGNSYVALYEENGDVIGIYTPWENVNPYTHHINLSAILPKGSTVKYSDSYAENWAAESFNDAAWTTGSQDTPYALTSSTGYFRATFNVDDRTKYPIADVSMYFEEGIIAYINGVEFYRFNLPSGDVTADTLGQGHLTSNMYRKSSVPSFMLKNGVNTLAFEVHRSSLDTTSLRFDVEVKLIEGDCINRLSGFTVTNSNNFNMAFEGPALAFDNNVDTKWLENGLPAYAVLKYDFDRREFINKIQVWSANDNEHKDPSSFTFEGSNDGLTWDVLLRVENDNNLWTERKQSHEWSLSGYSTAYNQYRFEITRTKEDNEETQISDLRLFSCHITNCPAQDGFPATNPSASASIDCPSGTFGVQTRTCGDASVLPEWSAIDSSSCLSLVAPAGQAYVDFAVALSHVSKDQMVVSGKSTLEAYLNSLTSASSSAFAFVESSENGVASTTAYVRITADNGLSSTIVSQLNSAVATLGSSLHQANSAVFPEDTVASFVKAPTVASSTSCAQDGIWEQSEVYETRYHPCDDEVNYTGQQYRTCLGEPYVHWGDVVSSCTLKPPTLSYEVSTLVAYKNAAISTLIPTVTGLELSAFTIDPSLPSGLLFNNLNGQISGAPASQGTTSHVISVSNPSGTASFTLTIAVGLSYCATDGDWVQTESGTMATAPCTDTVNYEGQRTRYCNTGYPAVWGSVSDGCLLKPAAISYSQNSYTLYKDYTPISATPTVSGGNLNAITISPSLPTGLSLNPTSGIISGTPSASTDAITYTVTVSNARGSASFSLTIEVRISSCASEGNWPETVNGQTVTFPCPDTVNYEGQRTRHCNAGYPASWAVESNTCVLKAATITYPSETLSGFKNDMIETIVPTISGGSLGAVTVLPELPDGLSLNPSNGAISGMPSTVVDQIYIVSVANARNTASFNLHIVISAVMCEEVEGWPATERNTIRYINCFDGLSGVQTRFCGYAGVGAATWGDASTVNCFLYDAKEEPGENLVFATYPILLEGISKNDIDEPFAYESFRQIFSNYLAQKSIASGNVTIVSTEARDSKTLVNLRVKVADAEKDEISSFIVDFINNESAGAINYIKASPSQMLSLVTGISIVPENITYQGNSLPIWIWIVIAVVVVIVIVLIIVICCCCCGKKKTSKKIVNPKTAVAAAAPVAVAAPVSAPPAPSAVAEAPAPKQAEPVTI